MGTVTYAEEPFASRRAGRFHSISDTAIAEGDGSAFLGILRKTLYPDKDRKRYFAEFSSAKEE